MTAQLFTQIARAIRVPTSNSRGPWLRVWRRVWCHAVGRGAIAGCYGGEPLLDAICGCHGGGALVLSGVYGGQIE